MHRTVTGIRRVNSVSMAQPSGARSNFACYSVQFSPFRPDLIAVAAAQYYGIVGNGKQSIYQRGQDGGWRPIQEWYYFRLFSHSAEVW